MNGAEPAHGKEANEGGRVSGSQHMGRRPVRVAGCLG